MRIINGGIKHMRITYWHKTQSKNYFWSKWIKGGSLINDKKYTWESSLIAKVISIWATTLPTMWYVRPAKAQTSLRIRAVWSEPLLVSWIFYEYLAAEKNHLGFLSLKGCQTGSSESTLLKMPHWKSHVAAKLVIVYQGTVEQSCCWEK